jgi:hypothetical protein
MKKHEYHQKKFHQAYNNDLRAWFGAKIEPELDTYFDYVDESKPWRKKDHVAFVHDFGDDDLVRGA